MVLLLGCRSQPVQAQSPRVISAQSWSSTDHPGVPAQWSAAQPAWAGAALFLCLAQAGHVGAEQSCSTWGPDPHGPTHMPNRVGLCWSPACALIRAGLCLSHTGAEPTSVPSRARYARTQPRLHPCRAEPDDGRAEHTSALGCSTLVLGRARVESAHCRAGPCRAVPGRAILLPVPASPSLHPGGALRAHVVLRRGARAEGRGWARAPRSTLPNGGAALPFPSESGPMASEGGAGARREGRVCGHVGAEGDVKVSRALWPRQSERRGRTGAGCAGPERSGAAGPRGWSGSEAGLWLGLPG